MKKGGPDALADRTASVVLLDGRTLSGELRDIRAGALLVGGQKEPIPFYEIQEIRLARKPPGSKPDFDSGPLVLFHGGERLVARVTAVEENRARLRIADVVELSVPLETVRAFRLREAHPSDDLFEQDLEKPPPGEDTIYARRGDLLSRVRGIFRGLDTRSLRVDWKGKIRSIRRRQIQGAILALIASERPEPDPPAVFELNNVGRLPAYLVELKVDPESRKRIARVRMPGAAPEEFQDLPLAAIERIAFASDRVLFLSTVEPSKTIETPVVGKSFPYRKDRSVGGGPITLGGRVYRRGLGVHSRSVLEYALGGQYRSFAAVIGLDDAARGKGSVTFRVIADGKAILERSMKGKDEPRVISLPLDEIDILRLEVDYGEDKLDIGDQADWADARVTR